MRKRRRIRQRAAAVIFWVLLILWMGFIFSMSARTGSESSDMSSPFAIEVAGMIVPGYEDMTAEEQQAVVSKIEVIIRKSAHFTEYAILGFLACLVVRIYISGNLARFLCAWGFSTLYAASDEIHQLFVPGRAGQAKDVLIDSAGACAGVLMCVLILHIILRIKNRKSNRIKG